MRTILPRMRCFGLEDKLRALLALCINKDIYYNPQLCQAFHSKRVRTLNEIFKHGNQVEQNVLALTEVKLTFK